MHPWRKKLAVIVSRNFCCKVYTRGKDIVFRGYKQDIEIATKVFVYLYATGDKLGYKEEKRQKKELGTAKGAYGSFIAGFLKGIDEGLSVQCTALMLVVPKAVEEDFAKFTANFRQTSTGKLTVTNSNLFNKGREEGKAAVKSRGIETKGGKS